MELLLLRNHSYGDGTSGRLFVNGVFSCFTLEDVVRHDEAKVPGSTAIPAGEYEFALEKSPKFGDNCMTIKDVPGFDHIRVHKGNTPTDTEGCVLVGDSLLSPVEGPRIAGGTSRPALDRLHTAVLKAHARGEKMQLVVEDAAP